MVSVRKIVNQKELKQAFLIREEVFVKEQKVAPEEEYDQYEDTSTHFLAYDADGKPCGTARWRQTDKGIKLERFAVLKQFRGTGVGRLLVQTVLRDIEGDPNVSPQMIYMHAQTPAIPFYQKLGFKTLGEEFEECGIKHYEMAR